MSKNFKHSSERITFVVQSRALSKNKYLRKRNDMFDIINLIINSKHTWQGFLESYYQLKLDKNPEFMMHPNLQDLIRPILNSKGLIYEQLEFLAGHFQEEGIIEYMKAISIFKGENQAISAIKLASDERIRKHKNGLEFVKACVHSKAQNAPKEIEEILRSDSFLNNKYALPYLKLMSSATSGEAVSAIRMLAQERINGNLPSLTEKQLITWMKEIASTKKLTLASSERTLDVPNDMKRLIFNYYLNKKGKKPGLFEFVDQRLKIMKNCSSYDSYCYVDKLLSKDECDKTVFEYAEILSLTNTPEARETVSEMVNRKIEGHFPSLIAEEFTKLLKTIASQEELSLPAHKTLYAKDINIYDYMKNIVFDLFQDKDQQEEGLVEYAYQLLKLVKNFKTINVTEYFRKARAFLEKIPEISYQQKIEFLEVISRSTPYENDSRAILNLLKSSKFRKDKNVLKYIEILYGNLDSFKTRRLCEILEQEEIRKQENIVEKIDAVARMKGVRGYHYFMDGIRLLKEHQDISLPIFLYTVSLEDNSDFWDTFVFITSHKELIQQHDVMPLLKRQLEANHQSIGQDMNSVVANVARQEGIIKREDAIEVLLQITYAQSKWQLNCLKKILENPRMQQKDNLIEIEKQILKKKTRKEIGALYNELLEVTPPNISASYSPYQTIDSFSTFMMSLYGSENAEGVLTEIIR